MTRLSDHPAAQLLAAELTTLRDDLLRTAGYAKGAADLLKGRPASAYSTRQIIEHVASAKAYRGAAALLTERLEHIANVEPCWECAGDTADAPDLSCRTCHGTGLHFPDPADSADGTPMYLGPDGEAA